MGMATVMYINEWRYYPGCWGTDIAGDIFAIWPTRLRKYMKGNMVPSVVPRDPGLFEWRASTVAPVAGPVEGGYGYNNGESLLSAMPGSSLMVITTGEPGRFLARPPQGDTATTKQRGLGGDVYGSAGKELKASRVRRAAEMIEITDRNTNYPSTSIAYRYNIDPRDPLECRAGPQRRCECALVRRARHVEGRE